MRFSFGILLATSLIFNKIEARKYPKCSDCTIYTTGKDGSLWGWENDNFCRISSKCSSGKNTTTTKKVTKKSKSTVINGKTDTTTKKKTTTTSTKTKRTTTTTEAKKTTTTTTPASHKTDANGNLICNGCEVTATGGQQSLWGWEDKKSCVIDVIKCNIKVPERNVEADKARAEANHKKNDEGFLICNQCEVTATGPEGSYWGWEDNYSCIIDNVSCHLTPGEVKKTTTPLQRGKDGVLICSTCQYAEVDKDTTTWNYENGERCRVIGSRCNFNTTPHPWCSGCAVTAYGNDGAAYGWENQNSCLINEVSCGLVNNGDDNKFQMENAASGVKIYSLYYIIATLLIIFINSF